MGITENRGTTTFWASQRSWTNIEIKVIYCLIFINKIKDTMDVMCSTVIHYITEFKASITAKTSVVNITEVF
jgi:hypothetical protein